MNTSALVKKLKYQHLLAFDKEGNIFEPEGKFVVPIFTNFTNRLHSQFVDETYVKNYLNYIKFSKLFHLTLEGAKEIEPVVLAYLSKKGEYVFTLARYGDFDYAFMIASNQKQSIIYDVDTRTLLFPRHKDKLHELWAKVDDRIMISSYGRMKNLGNLVKQDRRRFDIISEGGRWKPLVRDVVHLYYNNKRGDCKAKNEPLDFYYKNIVKEERE